MGRLSAILFQDRREAGQRLVPLLRDLGLRDPIVYGLLRGGAAVAAPVGRGRATAVIGTVPATIATGGARPPAVRRDPRPPRARR